ncbi:MAG: lipopolysaccharide heptosyltransferase II [Candidatus Omnitrophota bacterium]
MLKKTNLKNIVILRTDRIGEVLLSTMAVTAVKRQYPECKITFVTSEYSRPLVEGRTDIKEVITADTFTKDRWVSKALVLAGILRREKLDAAVILNPHKMLHLACFLAGVPRRIGYDRKWGGLLTDKIIDERDKGEKHEVEYTMDLMRLLGIECAAPAPRLFVAEETASAVGDLLAKKGIGSGKPLVAVHPGSSNPAKIWPYQNYAQLIRRVRDELDCCVAVLGTGEERVLAGKIAREAGTDVLDMAGELSLKELAAFIKRSVLFIGNDTGPMHMAAALRVPVIAIFARNIPGVSPKRWRPWGDGHVVFHEAQQCDPCYDADCPYDYRCMKAVTTDAVFEAVKELIQKRART